MFLIINSVAFCNKWERPRVDEETKKLNFYARAIVVSTLGDALISISSLVIGILGVLGVLQGLPPAAAYGLIGVSGFITLSWLVLAATRKRNIFKIVSKTFQRAISLKPNEGSITTLINKTTSVKSNYSSSSHSGQDSSGWDLDQCIVFLPINDPRKTRCVECKE